MNYEKVVVRGIDNIESVGNKTDNHLLNMVDSYIAAGKIESLEDRTIPREKIKIFNRK